MDWTVIVELQVEQRRVDGGTPDDAREYFKQCLEKLIEMGLLTHYHILSLPRGVVA